MDIYDEEELSMPKIPPGESEVETLTIEPAEVEEVREIKQVLSETWIHTYRPFLPLEVIQKVTTLWHSPETLAAEIENERVFFNVTKNKQGEIVGLVTAGRPSEEVVYISRLYVLPGHQRQGIGARLMDACIAAFPGTETLRLEVEEQNEKGLSFYRKQGFTEISRKEEELEGVSLTVVEMEKKL